jgi:ABC-type branched-subunit amino acid transport system ATPase component
LAKAVWSVVSLAAPASVLEESNMRSIVKAVSLNKYYDQYHALKDINIEVEQGEVLCIIGPSGSGKSTLLRCVNQLEKIDKGGLWVDGELVGYRVVGNKLHELNESQIARQRLATGMVFQRFNLFPHMTVLQNIIEGPVPGAQAFAERSTRRSPGTVGPRRPRRQTRQLPDRTVGRSAATRGDCPGVGHAPEVDAVR